MIDIVTILGAAAVIVDVIAIRSYVFNGYGSLFDGGILQDLDVWIAPLAVVIGLVMVRLRPGPGYEWLVGAASSFVLLDVGVHLVWLADQSDVRDGFASLRLLAAALAVAVAVLAWREATVPGPRINLVLGGLVVVGAVAAVSGVRDYGWHFGFPSIMWPVLALVVVLLLRTFAFPTRTTGAPALVVGGIIGVVAGVAEGEWSNWDKADSVLVLIGGFALMGLVGILRWRQSRAVREAETPTVAP